MPNLSKILNDNIPVLSFGFIKELYSIVQATANSNDALRYNVVKITPLERFLFWQIISG